MRIQGHEVTVRALPSLALFVVGLSCAPSVPPPLARGAGPAPVPIPDGYARARLELLEAVNADRAAAGRIPVGLDSLATVVAQAHAEAMAAEGFFSHYGTGGDAPYERLAEAGGTAHVRENIFRWLERGSHPAGDLSERFDVRQAEEWLMDSPGHRQTILDPHRTGVGLGIAVDPQHRTVYVVQDFVARHAEVEAPRQAWRRAPTPVSGRVLEEGIRPLLLLVMAEPVRRPWEEGRDEPPGGPYPDGSGEGTILPPWAIEWRPGDRSFAAELHSGLLSDPGRYYGIIYVAPEKAVERALFMRATGTRDGWPGGAFVIDVL